MHLDKTEFIIFSIQNTDFAIDSRYLVEVISDFSLQSFSFLPSFIKGIVNVKGKTKAKKRVRKRI